ncbi:IclR family transcriptional regulator [Streptosporangium lutulentum]
MSGAAPMRVLANATELIELLASEGALPLVDVATQIGVPRSSIYRLCEGLAAVGMVELLPDSRVRLSTRWLALADAARAGMSEWRGAPEVLAHLVERTGQTAFLSVPYGSSALCVDWCQGRAIDVLAYRPGSTMPLHVGAASRTFAAYGVSLPEGERRRRTEKTIIDSDELAADRERIRRDGYALSEEDVTVGIGAVGVPILAPDGTLRGALSLGGLVEDVRKHRDEFVAELRTGVERLSAV